MKRRPSQARRLVHGGQLLALALAYVVLGRLGLAMSPVSGFASLVWPPAGLSLAALVIGGYRLWPGVALGALITNLWMGAPPLAASGIAVGNTLEALVGAYALRSLPGFCGAFDRFTDVLALAVLAGLASTTLSATLGTASLALAGVVSSAHLARTWYAWWTGDLLSDLILAPLLLTWARGPRHAWRPAAIAEAALLVAALLAGAAFVFAQRPEVVAARPILQPYILFLPLIWAAVRFGPRGAATGVALVAVVAIWGTSTGHGAFVRPDSNDSLIALHVFLGSASLASLALGAVVAERDAEGRAQAWLAALVRLSADAVIGKTPDGIITSWNVAAQRLHGYAPEEVVGQPLVMLVPPDRRGELVAIDARVRRGERIEDLETVRCRKDGTTVEVAVTLSPIRDAAGALLGVSSIARDISERKRVERELRESEERQRLAVEAAHLGLWCWDLKRDRLAWTPLCRSIHGVGPDVELTYPRFLAMLHPDDRERTDRAVQRSLVDHADYRIEHRVVWPDGDVRWISGLGRPVYDEAGNLDQMLGVAIDVTAQKQAEHERAELLERAEAATRARDDFLAVLSHELRTPLQSMLGWTQLLKKRPHDGGLVQKGLETIERNVKAQSQLIEDLLDVSRIVAGKLRLARERVDLAQIVAWALEPARAAAEAKGIRVEAAIEPVTCVLGDPDRLQQVVSNLLTNAVKFTPSGGRIGVRLLGEGAAARIIVEDTGRGISPQFLPLVFDRFLQAEQGITRSHGGLGLGLAIVRRLVELHGGTVKAESPGEGQGATFTVTLPLDSAGRVALAAERGERRQRSGAGAEVTLAGVRVLVVDDDPDTRELLELVLREAGAEVQAVSSVRAAVVALAWFRPNLLLSDVGMPEEDGYALIRQVRARESADGGHLQAVALTAFASRADREQALAMGFEAHLAKPVSAGDLARTVAGLVGRAA